VKQDVVNHLHVSPDKIKTIYEGASLPEQPVGQADTAALKKLGITKPYLLFVSQWRPHKGIGMLVEAFNEMKANQDIQLVVTGKPNNHFPEIPAAIDASPYRKDIITPGFVEDAVLDALYANAELFVFPSWYEGFGLPPLEAMIRGVAVASSNSSVMPEVLSDGAVYFDAKDPHNMAEVLTETLADESGLKKLKERGLAQAKKYSWKKMAQETLALYEQVAR
jgi:glycosyltransferase involved in cell wall biosynthesis